MQQEPVLRLSATAVVGVETCFCGGFRTGGGAGSLGTAAATGPPPFAPPAGSASQGGGVSRVSHGRKDAVANEV
jgi:hypothetical protein